MKRILTLLLFVCLALCLALGLSACLGNSEPTCEEAGHSWEFAGDYLEFPTCTEPGWGTFYCTRCHETCEDETEPLGHEERVHEGSAATCTTNGSTDRITCDRCHETLVESETIPAGHVKGDYIEHKNPMRYSTGTIYYACQNCTSKLSVTLPALTSEKYTADFSGELDKYTYVDGDFVFEFEIMPYSFYEYKETVNGEYACKSEDIREIAFYKTGVTL